MIATPEVPISHVSEDWATTKAAYRFFQNDRVTSEQILKPHQARTCERMATEPIVLGRVLKPKAKAGLKQE